MSMGMDHKKRIINELRAAGMSAYGTMKMETEHLPRIVHSDEHIGGVVYGRTTGDKVGSAMLIATDRRITFLDVKPFYSTSDEVSYDVVAGVKMNVAGPFAGVVLHTRVRDYGLRFVNKNCASRFIEYIEKHIELQQDQQAAPTQNEVWKSTKREQNNATNTPSDASNFIASQSTAILSTIDREGNAHGAVIHYIYLNDQFYFLSKSQTAKSQHIALHGQVALTIHRTDSLKVAQISGLAEQETDSVICKKVFDEISKPKQYVEGNHFPPVLSMRKGETAVYRISPTNIVYRDFSVKSW